MEAAIIGALVTALLATVGWMVGMWVKGLRERLNRHELLHEEHRQRHGLHEVKHATIVAHQESLISRVDEAHEKLDRLIGYANGGNSKRGSGEA